SMTTKGTDTASKTASTKVEHVNPLPAAVTKKAPSFGLPGGAKCGRCGYSNAYGIPSPGRLFAGYRVAVSTQRPITSLACSGSSSGVTQTKPYGKSSHATPPGPWNCSLRVK